MRHMRLLSVVVVLGAGPATAADPDFPPTGLFAVPQAPAMTSPSAADPTTAPQPDDFHGPIFAPVTDDDPFTRPIPRPFARPGPAPWYAWGGAEVLYGAGRGVAVPPLVTTGPLTAGLLPPGTPGQPGTTVLFGGRRLLDDWRVGLRAELGLWLDASHTWGTLARFYSLFSAEEQVVASGTGTNVVSLPQFLPADGQLVPLPIIVSLPGLVTGSATASVGTTFGGGDIGLRRRLTQTPSGRIDGWVGYRQLYLGDRLGTAFTASTSLLPLPLPLTLTGFDDVRTRNHFYGAHVGSIGSLARGRWMVQALGAVALGVTVNELDYERVRLLGLGPTPLLPLEQTALSDRTTYLGVAAEGGIKLHLLLTEYARLTFGYTTLYWWNVRRAAEQYQLGPALADRTTHFGIHTLAWGVELRF